MNTKHKTSVIILFLLFFTFQTFGQTEVKNDFEAKVKTFENKKKFFYNYDKFKESTHIGFKGFSVISSEKGGGIISFGTSAFVKEESETSFFIVFASSSRSWRFLRNHALIFLVDGEKIKMGDGNHDGKISSSRTSVSVSETVIFKIEKSQLENLAKAEKVELQLGSFEGILETPEKQAIKDLLSIIKE